MVRFGCKKIIRAGIACLLVLAAGCVSETIEPEYIPRVSTSQSSDGKVTISWASITGYNYRLVAMDQGKVYIDEKVYPGTGEMIVVEFMRDPAKPLPDYRVKPERTGKR